MCGPRPDGDERGPVPPLFTVGTTSKAHQAITPTVHPKAQAQLSHAAMVAGNPFPLLAPRLAAPAFGESLRVRAPPAFRPGQAPADQI